jgi:hypothetical protein
MSQPPEKKVSEQILEEMAKLKEKLDSLTTSQKPNVPLASAAPSTATLTISDEAQPKTHKTLKEMLDCPDCFPDVRAQVIQRHRDNTKDEKYECKGCGSGVKEEWKNCPLCGSSSAKPRD